MNRDVVINCIISFIVSIACGLLCCCGNPQSKDSLTRMQESNKTVLAEFVAATETKPETVTEIIDGFAFNMSEKEYQARYAELQKLECDCARLEINGSSYYAYYNKPSFCDGKLYDLDIQLLFKEPDNESVTKADFDSLAVYFKTVYGAEPFNYLITEDSVSGLSIHHWRKDNLYLKLSWCPEGETASAISIEYRNGAILSKDFDM